MCRIIGSIIQHLQDVFPTEEAVSNIVICLIRFNLIIRNPNNIFLQLIVQSLLPIHFYMI